VKNIFFVAHYGQIIQCNQFIRVNNLENNELAILYTTKNMTIPKMVEDTVDRSLFNRIARYKLPTSCMQPHIGRIIKIRAKYKKYLQEHKPTDIYVFSFEGHYVLLEELACRMGIRIHLIEEGLGTYKLALPDYRDSAQKTWKQTCNNAFCKSSASQNLWVKGFVALLQLPFDLWDFSKRLYVQERTQSALLNVMPRKWRAFKLRFSKFESLHVAFPDVLQSRFPDIKISPYFVHEPSNALELSSEDVIASQTVEKYNITSEDIVFVSQRYAVSLPILVPHIIRALERAYTHIGNPRARLFIKLHPKESELVRAAYLSAKSKLNRRLIVIDSPAFPVELLVAQAKIQALIGISSSSLVYSEKINPELKIFSIGDSLIREISKYPAERQALSQMEAHVSLLKLFSHVKQV
jgi:poly-alpha-2,8 sialosyl sialyltransferase